MADLSGTTQKVQIEQTQFRGPVSESLMQTMGGAINFLLETITPIGSIVPSMMTEVQFQAAASDRWILADGRAVPGTQYAALIGVNVPDLRGVALRGKNNGLTGSHANPDGDLALGTYQDDQLESHTHTYLYYHFASLGDDSSTAFAEVNKNPSTGTTDPTGGNETRMKNVTVNYFIRVN